MAPIMINGVLVEVDKGEDEGERDDGGIVGEEDADVDKAPKA